ncbi:VOC family protein [Streptomyces sp. NPDC058989]|uniref:VOC family protein n=1 Tax=Streptomyces sp. NPDC058989 TaxID=3346686 RepID=UPI00367D9F47
MMNIAPCLAVRDPLATAAFYQKLGFGVLDTGPLNPEHPLLIITHDGKPALMIQTDSSLRELLPTMQPTNGCSGIHYFTVADFDATIERIRPHVEVVKDTVTNYDRTGREFFFRDPDGYILGIFGPDNIDAFRQQTETGTETATATETT